MHSSGSITSMFGPSWKQSTGHTSTQSVYLHLIQASVTTKVMLCSTRAPPKARFEGAEFCYKRATRAKPDAARRRRSDLLLRPPRRSSPSSAGFRTIWQLKRLVGRRSRTQPSMPSSCASGGGSFGAHSGSTYTWQVAHEQAPPHSATMPLTSLSTAASMSVVPAGSLDYLGRAVGLDIGHLRHGERLALPGQYAYAFELSESSAGRL